MATPIFPCNLSALNSDDPLHSLELMLPDINGHIRGKLLSVDPNKDLNNYEVLLPASAITSDFCGNCVEETGLVWETGDPDYPCTLELATLKPIPWRKGVAQVLLNMSTPKGDAVAFDPRGILKNIITRLAERQLFATAAMELEFTLSREADPSQMAKLAISKRTDDRMRVYEVDATDEYKAIFAEIMAAAKAQDIPANCIIAEAAPGQYEINLNHVADPLLAADHALFLKRIIKGVALQHGVTASFMAKPFADFPGNGLHMHISLLNAEGTNIFSPTLPDTHASDAMSHAIAGLQRTMRASQILLLPNANSFKRIMKKSYAPSSTHWGYNNRNVALRIPSGNTKARRIEHRLSGADANPYLVMATVLMGILQGLEHPQMPTAETAGIIKPENGILVHNEPYSALADFQENPIITEYFGTEFQRIYSICFEAEIDRYNSTIMPIEYDWFFNSA